MRRSRTLVLSLAVVAACAPAYQPSLAVAPLPEPPAESPSPAESPAPADTRSGVEPSRGAEFDALRARGLMVPVAGVSPSQIPDSYNAPRDGGRRHESVDILAPRGTPVLAADDGIIVRVGTNALGGKVIWETDTERRFAYYYAHLDHYARGIREGQAVSKGDLIGYVGTTGNAPPDTPHLHFQVMRMLDARHFNDGPPFNPIGYFTATGATR